MQTMITPGGDQSGNRMQGIAGVILTSLFPIVDFETMARTPVQTNRRFRDDG